MNFAHRVNFTLASISLAALLGLGALGCSIPSASTPTTTEVQPELKSLVLKNGTSTQTLDLGSRAATIDYHWASFVAVPTSANAGETITVNGSAVASGADSASQSAIVGTTQLTVKVKNSAGSEVSYAFTLTRPDPMNPPGKTILGTSYIKGADGLIGGGDDVATGWGYKTYDSKGRVLETACYTAGTDGLLRTADDDLSASPYGDYRYKYVYTYTDAGQATYSEYLSGTFAAPVQSLYEKDGEYDSYGRPITLTYYWACGPDAIWGTDDDTNIDNCEFFYSGSTRCRKRTSISSGVTTISYLYYQYDTAGNLTKRVYFKVGADGLPMTADDEVTSTSNYAYTYDARGKMLTKSYSLPATVLSGVSYLIEDSYTYDDQERMTKKRHSYNTGRIEEWRYVYSDSGELEREDFYQGSSEGSLAMVFYTKGRILSSDESVASASLPAAY